MLHRHLVVALPAWLALSCGPPAAVAELAPPAGPAPSTTGTSSAAAAPHHGLLTDQDLAITLAPEPAPNALVRVTIAARPDDAPLSMWQSARPVDLLGTPEASDGAGPIPVTVTAVAGGTRVTLARAPSGVTWLTYTVRAELPAYPDPPAIVVDPDRFEAAGEPLLLLPSAFDEKSVRATLHIETDEVGSSELTSAASSLGLGPRLETTSRGGDLREAFFLAGLLGRGTFRAPEGHDDAAWLGYTAFDPRPIVADMAGFRTALRQLFGAADADKVTFLFLSDSRSEGSFVVSRRPRSVLARVGVQERWSAPLRVAVAAAVVHGWIGARLWIGPNDREHEAEAYWFTEGVTRKLAAELLFRYGLISPAEAAAEAEALASLLATSPLTRLSNTELAQKPRAAVPLLVARGALYAMRVDALLRARSKGKRSLDHVLRDLYGKAAAQKAALPTSAWIDALVSELGEAERGAFRDAIELGKPFDLPEDALGPCFRKVTRGYVGFELGFDEEATRRATPQKIVGLVPGGPAAKAGLHEGDEVRWIRIDRRAADTPVDISVPQGEGTRSIRYNPEGKRAKGPGFERKKDVSDDACTP